MKPPKFWQQKKSFLGSCLQPLAMLYQSMTHARIHKVPVYTAKLPVICIGNATLGGSGKTPVVQALADLLKENGKQPAILLRGYGGNETGPLAVDPAIHDVARVGDEALLHAEHATTVVAADRVAGAHLIEKDAWTTHIVMDDGLQNPSLKKDLSFLVTNGENPFGNERVFPAGPLREPVDDAIRRVQAVIVIGDDRQHLATRFGFLLPIFYAALEPSPAGEFKGKSVLAFAGIGRPQNFFDSLVKTGVQIGVQHTFPDHYAYRPRDVEKLLRHAEKNNLLPITTRKDWIRLPKTYQDRIRVLDVALVWREPHAIAEFLKQKGVL
jgi:tetraacyldisaccharide 4'-kinase